jgi:hypothetical protein
LLMNSGKPLDPLQHETDRVAFSYREKSAAPSL